MNSDFSKFLDDYLKKTDLDDKVDETNKKFTDNKLAYNIPLYKNDDDTVSVRAFIAKPVSTDNPLDKNVTVGMGLGIKF